MSLHCQASISLKNLYFSPKRGTEFFLMDVSRVENPAALRIIQLESLFQGFHLVSKSGELCMGTSCGLLRTSQLTNPCGLLSTFRHHAQLGAVQGPGWHEMCSSWKQQGIIVPTSQLFNTQSPLHVGGTHRSQFAFPPADPAHWISAPRSIRPHRLAPPAAQCCPPMAVSLNEAAAGCPGGLQGRRFWPQWLRERGGVPAGPFCPPAVIDVTLKHTCMDWWSSAIRRWSYGSATAPSETPSKTPSKCHRVNDLLNYGRWLTPILKNINDFFNL